MSYLRPPVCGWCKHLKSGRTHDEEHERFIYHCAAYPEGIPEAVREAGHLYPKPGDSGIQFEARGNVVLPEEMRHSQEEEDANYQWYANYFEELNMTDAEFEAKMKREHGKDWHMYRKPSRGTIID